MGIVWLTCRSFSGRLEMWMLSLSRNAVVPEQVIAAPQQASRSGSCTGMTAGQGHPVELSAAHRALCSVLPSCIERSTVSLPILSRTLATALKAYSSCSILVPCHETAYNGNLA